MDDVEARLRDANALVAEIAACGRRFFFHPDGDTGRFEMADGKILWRDERNGALIAMRDDRYDHRFSHGGTLRSFLSQLRSWVSNGEPASGGAFGPHWAYPEDDAARLRELACEMRFLHWEDELEARANLRRAEDPQRPPQSVFRLGRNQGEWTVIMQWPTEDGMDRHCMAFGPMPRQADAAAAMERFRQVPVCEPAPEAPAPSP